MRPLKQLIALLTGLILMLPGNAFSQSATQTCIKTTVLDKMIDELQDCDLLKDQQALTVQQNSMLYQRNRQLSIAIDTLQLSVDEARLRENILVGRTELLDDDIRKLKLQRAFGFGATALLILLALL